MLAWYAPGECVALAYHWSNVVVTGGTVAIELGLSYCTVPVQVTSWWIEDAVDGWIDFVVAASTHPEWLTSWKSRRLVLNKPSSPVDRVDLSSSCWW